MKKILLTVVLLSALTAAQAHTRHTHRTARPHSHVTIAPVATAASDDTVIYLGTNEFYIALEREGVYRG